MANKKHDLTDKDLLMTIEGMVRDGCDNKQIAEYLHYNEQYFCKVLKNNSELSEAIKRARKPITFAIENSLIKRCIGMKVKSVTKRWLIGDNGEKTNIEVVQETETELPPDGRLIQFYLSQRKPELYNKQPNKMELTGKDGKDLNAPMFIFQDASGKVIEK